MIARTGHCPLPVHDSFIVAETDAQALIETMTEVAHEHGINPPLKVSRQDSIMRVTNDLEPKTGVQAKREPEDGCGPDIQPTAPKGCGGQHRTPGHGHCHSLGGNNPHAAGTHISLGPRGLSGAHVEKRNLATGADSIGTWFRHARRRYGERAPPGVSRLAATVAGQTQR